MIFAVLFLLLDILKFSCGGNVPKFLNTGELIILDLPYFRFHYLWKNNFVGPQRPSGDRMEGIFAFTILVCSHIQLTSQPVIVY